MRTRVWREAMRVGAIVCKKGDGTLYFLCEFSYEVAGIPRPSQGETLIFRLDEDVNSPWEMFKKAREEANRRGIGKVVNLPD